MSVYHGCAVPTEPEEGVESPRTGVTATSELPCGFWGLNPNPLQEQGILTAEPSLQPLNKWDLFYFILTQGLTM